MVLQTAPTRVAPPALGGLQPQVRAPKASSSPVLQGLSGKAPPRTKPQGARPQAQAKPQQGPAAAPPQTVININTAEAPAKPTSSKPTAAPPDTKSLGSPVQPLPQPGGPLPPSVANQGASAGALLKGLRAPQMTANALGQPVPGSGLDQNALNGLLGLGFTPRGV